MQLYRDPVRKQMAGVLVIIAGLGEADRCAGVCIRKHLRHKRSYQRIHQRPQTELPPHAEV